MSARLETVLGDLTLEQTDVVVNAANPMSRRDRLNSGFSARSALPCNNQRAEKPRRWRDRWLDQGMRARTVPSMRWYRSR